MRRIVGYLPILFILFSVASGLIGRMSEPDRPGPEAGWADKGRIRIGDERQRRRPDPRDGRVPGGRELPEPSGRGPTVSVEIPYEVKNSQGTAFSIDAGGVWMTARHVADGCDRIFILSGPRQGFRARRVYVHDRADVAVLWTGRGAPPLAMISQRLRFEQVGYHFGYPSGEPAAVSSRLLGRATMRATGRYRTIEPVVAWAEAVRVPDSSGGLQGISGGPALDANGRLIGVTVAGSRRRGRVFTTALVSMRAALDRAGARIGEAGAGRPGAIDEGNFARYGERLRERLTVAPVICLVDGKPRRGRRGR